MNEKYILEKLKANIAINNFKNEYENEHTLNKEVNWRVYNMKKKVITSICSITILISGVVFATANYDRIASRFGLGKGIEEAVNNGYIATPEMEYQLSSTTVTEKSEATILDNINVKAKVDDFLMDDLNISTHFTFEIDNKINETIDLNELQYLELKDLIVTDENNKILYCMDKDAFEQYCERNNLNYKFSEFNENYYNCGLNSFIVRKYKETGSITFTYNMYSSGEKSFPKSKKLNFKFTNIEIGTNENNIVKLTGNWNIKLDVPKEMYNRKSIAYKVVSCENPDFQITNATLTNTGFELGIIISNIERPIEPQILVDLRKKEFKGEITNEELNRILNTEKEYMEANYNFHTAMLPVAVYDRKNSFNNEDIENMTYVENEKGEKFKASMSASRRQDSNFIDGNKFSFYETFELTTYTATNKLKVRVMYKDNPYIIELEKLN